MAVPAENISFEAAETTFNGKTYEKLWTIPNWEQVLQTEDEVKALSFDFETSNSSGVETKWLLGFRTFTEGTRAKFRLYWKLMEAKGFEDGKVHATMNSTVMLEGSIVRKFETQERTFDSGETMDLSSAFNANANFINWINSNGEVTFQFKLVIMEPEVPSADLQMKLFQNHSVGQAQANFVRLLQDKSTADLKIVTSDGKELFAHRIILQAQCPVFESMFRSDMSENKTGIVNVEDVTAKTMGIFLHLFYSGELLPSWKDPDTVVEFTYAAGKYQLTNVLELLDKVVGSRDEEDATHADVELLDLARKLDLKTAEKELMNRIVKTMSKMESGGDFFTLWGIGGKE